MDAKRGQDVRLGGHLQMKLLLYLLEIAGKTEAVR